MCGFGSGVTRVFTLTKATNSLVYLNQHSVDAHLLMAAPPHPIPVMDPADDADQLYMYTLRGTRRKLDRKYNKVKDLTQQVAEKEQTRGVLKSMYQDAKKEHAELKKSTKKAIKEHKEALEIVGDIADGRVIVPPLILMQDFENADLKHQAVMDLTTQLGEVRQKLKTLKRKLQQANVALEKLKVNLRQAIQEHKDEQQILDAIVAKRN